MLSKFKLSLLSVFGLALAVRLVNLTSVPVSLSIDEVNIGHNAYSILKTGQDEWGNFMPLAFKSVGDYKPPVNVYLTSISIALFGLNEFAVRLPVALLGASTVLTFAFLLKQFKFKNISILFGSLWLALSPWHIVYSRASFEAITSLFFLVSSVALFLHWTNTQRLVSIMLCIVAASLSVWSYHSTRVFTPLMFVFLAIYFRRNIIKLTRNKRGAIILLLIILFFTLPFLYLTFGTPAISQRALSTSIFREPNLLGAMDEASPISNTYTIFRHWAGKYLNYYDLRFWFWKGLLTPAGYPDVGLLYLVNLPIFFSGAYYLAAKSKNKFLKILTLFWFFAGPLPASLTMNEQHTLRVLTWLPFFGIVITAGFEQIITIFRKSKIILAVYIILLATNFVFFVDIYAHHYQRHYSEYWQYGYEEISKFVCENKANYEDIIITPVFGSEGPLTTGIPYSYVLFYCKYDPKLFLNTRVGAQKTIENIDYRRPDINDMLRPNSLIIASPWDLDLSKVEDKIIQKIYFLNGSLGFVIIETQ